MRNMDWIEPASRFDAAALPIMFNGRICNQPEVSEHCHEFDEIVLVVAGTGIHHTRYSDMPISAGDVLFIPEKESHAYYDCDGMEIYNCCVRTWEMPMPLGELYQHPAFSAFFLGCEEQYRSVGDLPRLHLDAGALVQAEMILIHCNREVEARQLGWALSCFGGFLEFLTLILRNYHRPERRLQDYSVSERISVCIQLLHDNMLKTCTIPWLCRKVGLSESTLFRNFKRVTRMSINEYKIAIRLAQATNLLLNSPKLSLGEIALRSGFCDSNYFSRLFRQRFGCTPREYRKKNCPEE